MTMQDGTMHETHALGRQATLFTVPPAGRPADDMARSAIFSEDGLCRFELGCQWAPGAPISCLLANPSLADGDRNDMTSLTVFRIAMAWKMPGFTFCNVVPYISPQMDEIWGWIADPANRQAFLENLRHLRRQGEAAALHIVAFGNEVLAREPDLVAEALHAWLPAGRTAFCFGTTSTGAPIHPAARGKHRLVPDQVRPAPWDESALLQAAAALRGRSR